MARCSLSMPLDMLTANTANSSESADRANGVYLLRNQRVVLIVAANIHGPKHIQLCPQGEAWMTNTPRGRATLSSAQLDITRVYISPDDSCFVL